MAALTTDTTLFHADGASDPQVGFNGVTLIREIDFGITKAKASVNYEFIGLPDGFVAVGMGIEELDHCAAGTITAKAKNDSSTLGSALTVGQTEEVNGVATPKLSKAVDALSKAFNGGDMLCIVPSVDMSEGKVRVSVTGVLPNADTRYSPELAAPWRAIGNEKRNVAPCDRKR